MGVDCQGAAAPYAMAGHVRRRKHCALSVQTELIMPSAPKRRPAARKLSILAKVMSKLMRDLLPVGDPGLYEVRHDAWRRGDPAIS